MPKTKILNFDCYVHEFADAFTWKAEEEYGNDFSPETIEYLRKKYPSGYRLLGWNSNGDLKIDLKPEQTKKAKIEERDADELRDKIYSRGVAGFGFAGEIETAIGYGWIEKDETIKNILDELYETGSAWPKDELQRRVADTLFEKLTPLQLSIVDAGLSGWE